MNLPEHLGSMLTNTEAAKRCGVSLSGVSNWVHRGYLTSAGIDIRNGRRVHVYRLIDVLRAANDAHSRDSDYRRTRERLREASKDA
ncbi:helix-turn-helix domain-containing protein [Jatrophihabitans sp. DSM 45814]